MSFPLPEDELRVAYARFAESHHQLKDQLMSTVSVRKIGTGARAADFSQVAVNRGRMLWCVVTTAAVIAAAAIGLRPADPQAAQAFVLEDVPRRMAEVKSLHLQGWIYGDAEQPGAEPPRYAQEIYVSRPATFSHTFIGMSPGSVSTGRIAGNGENYIQIVDDQKLAIVGKGTKLGAELRAEFLLQSGLAGQFLQHAPEDYRPMRHERIGGVDTVVYEFVSPVAVFPGFREVIWLNPQSGLPVRAAMYFRDAQGNENLQVLYEKITANRPAPEGMFAFQAPKGYRLVEGAEIDLVREPQGQAGANDLTFTMYHAFNIVDRAALVCWSCEAMNGAAEQVTTPEPVFQFTASSKVVECTAELLRTDESPAGRLHWSLVRPKNRQHRLSVDTLTATVTTASNGSLSSTARPLRFSEARMREIVVEVQKALQSKGSAESAVTTYAELLRRLEG